jgi:hypothetical protein
MTSERSAPGIGSSRERFQWFDVQMHFICYDFGAYAERHFLRCLALVSIFGSTILGFILYGSHSQTPTRDDINTLIAMVDLLL